MVAMAFPVGAQAPVTVAIQATGVNANVDSAVDSTGITHVVYERGGSIFYVQGSAGTEETVDAPPGGISDSHPAIAIGPDGAPQVVFAATDGQYYTKRTGANTWSVPALIADVLIGGFPDIAVGSDNLPQVVYAVDTNADTFAEIWYSSGDLTASTNIWDGFSDATGGSLFSNPHIALDSTDAYHVIAAHEAVSAGPSPVSTFNIIYDTNAGALGNSFESPLRATAVNLSQNPITAAPSLGVRVVYDQAGSAYSATLGSAWSEVTLGAFSQLAVTSDANMVAAVYLNGDAINYAVDGGSGFSAGTLVAQGSNPSATLGTNLSVYYLLTSGVDIQVRLTTLAYPTQPPVVTLQPANQSIVYGGNATFTATATGLPIPTVQWQLSMDGTTWMDIMPGDAAYSGAMTATLTVINPMVTTGMPAQFRAVFSNGTTVNSLPATLTVTAKPITVTADAKAKIYGEADPALTWTVTVGGPAALNGALLRAPGENVGTYPIGVGTLQSANPNYAITFFPASFTITPMTLTVTAEAKSKFYGDVDPALTFVSSDPTATFTGALARAAGENAGVYAISQGTLANTNYTITFVGASFTINKATPVITWNSPAAVIVGTVLSGTQLNATATSPYAPFAAIPGTFNYNPSAGTALTVGGSQFLSLVFLPTDSVNYNSPVNATVTINVTNSKIIPVITWANPASIVYGTALDGTQLNASSGGVAGTFSYSPIPGTILNVGAAQILSVTFMPTDTATYNNAVGSTTITVTKATPTITWANPVDITFGTPLGATQLNATASIPGTFAYTLADGTTQAMGAVLALGANQTLNASFTPTDAANYNTNTASVAINVLQATSVITWANPADIVVGTALGATQLNATANVPGTFAYTLADGTTQAMGAVLALGANQTLNASFTPTDAVNYSTATASVTINVIKPQPSITLTSSSNPAADAQTQIILTATVASTLGTPTGTVTFRDGTTVIGTPVPIVFAHATITVAFAAGTSHDITATYNGDANFASIMSAVLTQTVTAPPASGGGGGGGGFGSQLVGINLSGTSPFMDGNGKSLTAGVLKTPDGKLTLNVPVGVFIWNAAGAAQPFLSANTIETPPAAPSPQVLIMAYELGTTGVTFNPGIGIAFSYSDAQLPAGVTESSLYIAWWNGSAWVKLTSSVDATANSVSATITHFTTFALIGQIQPTTTTTPPPTQTTTPPPSQTTTAPPSQTTTPPPGSTTTLPPVGGTTTNWLLIGGIVAAALVLGLALYLMSRSKKPV